MNDKQIKSALISVYYKDGLAPIIKKLNELNIKIYSTGGTQSFIEEQGVKATAIEDLTSYPSILGGRVKTLHPKVFGGILARRENPSDIAQMNEYQIPEIDLVIVDLYPFEETVSKGGTEQEIIEKIDIGGISLIRAAAKNFKDVTIISSKGEYSSLLEILDKNKGVISYEDRKRYAAKAFMTSSHYDTAIFNYFNICENINVYKESILQSNTLRYGENPHQKGVFYGDLNEIFEQLHGKELSYNNLLDLDSAINLTNEFSEPTFVVIKHNNACGVASRANILDAWKDALAGDPVSAFGGVLSANKHIDKETAEEVNKIFFEIITAPSYSEEALEILKQKKNRIILIQKTTNKPTKTYRSLLSGVLEQDYDSKIETKEDLKVVTKISPKESEIEDLLFANKIVKHTKSNSIVLAKNKQLLGSGMGQTSRIDSLKQAIIKAKAFNFDLNNCVMASDAFFPFPDCVEIACNNGVKSVIQPGGSIKDQESVDFCDKNNLSMVMTGFRHFKH